MRVFVIACLAVVVLGIGAFLTLGSVQKPAGTVYTTDGARISQKWTWRQVVARPKAAPQNVSMAMPAVGAVAEDCSAGAWSYILADFSSTTTADIDCER